MLDNHGNRHVYGQTQWVYYPPFLQSRIPRSDCWRLLFYSNSPVSLWFTFLEGDFPFRPPLAARTGSSAGPRHPQRLQALRRLLIGELHLLPFLQAAETLHHQLTLWKTTRRVRFCPIFTKKILFTRHISL